ncbi:protoporphyrinogen oxidase [Paludifilum halophilum]|uniref:Coproporphyrinogen III oxidase n=1 Tax=Paludifilum halophilum TaxID=1642702 RepID=A0A235BDI0_9BACL|nr:protoporphyrinogen oxidase [Paludifilum halophilum]OYD09655.1 protoporphyrinogen oxidase [Paludifilum halophilum]
MNHREKRVAIVGGGITGLSAAFYLKKEAEQRGWNLSLTLIESQNRLGGKIATEQTDGFVMEKGPDSFLERKPSAKQLVTDLGLEDQLVRNQTGQAYILHHSQLIPIPEGAVMGVPTRLAPFAFTPLFSPAGKIRAAGDLVLPRSRSEEDVSVGSFFRRRLGDEVVDKLIEPLLSGIYAGNIDRLSLMATFPQYVRMEKNHRSLILGTKKTRSSSATGNRSRPKGQFLTLKRGLSHIVDALEEYLSSSSLLKGTALQHMEPLREGYRLQLDSGEEITADAVVMAVPHSVVSKALPAFDFLQRKEPLPFTSVATVIMGYDESSVFLDREGTGFVVPREEETTITACTWTHKKWPHTTPSGKVMLRCYVGRFGDEGIVDEPDDTIVNHVQKDLKKILNIQSPPEWTRVTRWRRAMPQYTVGHANWVQRLKEQTRHRLPGLFLTGASYSGVGIPDCIDQGKEAAREVLELLGKA